MVFYDLLYLFNGGRSIISISFTFRKFSGYLFPRYDNITTYFKEKFDSFEMIRKVHPIISLRSTRSF
jgi:hypothetical protein